MATTEDATQIHRLENGDVWIEGRLISPPSGMTGPMVIGRDWLLEMIAMPKECSRVFFWAPFAIVFHIPQVDGVLGRRFIGYSSPSVPPCDWLTTSMMFDLNRTGLARTPQEFIARITEPRSYVALENTAATPLSQNVKRLITATLTESVLIRDIASKLGVSHAHMTRQFKADFGLSPLDYQHRLRVTEAMSQLSRGKEILRTGYDVGFADTSRFYKNFRKITGTSPGKCRR